MGEVQVAKAEPSRLHWKVEPASDEEKEKLAKVLLTLPYGPEALVVSGAVVSAAVVKDQL